MLRWRPPVGGSWGSEGVAVPGPRWRRRDLSPQVVSSLLRADVTRLDEGLELEEGMRVRRWLIWTAPIVVLVIAAAAVAAGFPPFVRMWGSAGASPGSFASPDEISIDARGDVYMADRKNNRVQKFDFQGRLLAVI